MLKDEKKILKKCQRQKKIRYTVKGIKGRSILSSVSGFDCIWGYSYDYMHGVLLGVTRQLWIIWSEDFLKSADIKLKNSHLLKIEPPSEIHRTPRI